MEREQSSGLLAISHLRAAHSLGTVQIPDGCFVGDKEAATVGDLLLQLKCSHSFYQIRPKKHTERETATQYLIPDAGIRLFLAVEVAHEPFPVQPAHSRSTRQAIVQCFGPKNAQKN